MGEFLDRVKVWYNHPEIFAEEVLNEKLTNNQRYILKSMTESNRIAIKSANSIGKTHLMGIVVPWFFYTRIACEPEKSTIAIFTAPIFSQIQTGIYARTKLNIKKAGIVMSKKLGRDVTLFDSEPSEDTNKAKFFYSEDSYIMGVASKTANEIAGKHADNVLVIFDEAQGLKEDVYSGFKGILTAGKKKEILIGNTTLPNGCAGRFYEAFQENSDYTQVSITSFETPNFVLPGIVLDDYLVEEDDENHWIKKLDKFCGTDYQKAKFQNRLGMWEDEVLEKLPVMGLANPIGVNAILKDAGYNIEDYEFKTRVLAEFPDGTGSSTYPLSWIQQSKEKWSDYSYHIPGKKILGIDFGRGVGRDKSSFAFRDGNKGMWVRAYDLNATEILNKVHEIHREIHFDQIRLENNGEGIHFATLLRDYGYKVYEIDAGSSPGYGKYYKDYELKKETDRLKKLFVRKRDETWWNLRLAIDPNKPENEPIFLLPPDKDIERQMRASSYKYNPKQQIVVSDKDELRKRLKQSTDKLDSLLVTLSNVIEDEDSNVEELDTSSLVTFNFRMNLDG